jgi:hypothetical protein
MVEFAYNNIIHSSTQQTPLFANHGLHPKFDIQGVNKVMNPTTKDWAMWLLDELELNLYLTLNKCKDDIKKMLMNVKSNNASSRLEIKFGLNGNISTQQGHQRSWIIKG